MIILFFCASLEPGRDGVGDYTRRLASACAARGHACTLIALHDPHVSKPTDASSGGLRFIRFPSFHTWHERLSAAFVELRRLRPDWVSWQFVAHGFHPRGFLPAALLKKIAKLRGPRCHFFFHELWIGLEVGSSLRARALGWRQRQGVLNLLNRLAPDLIHTSNHIYREVLVRESHPATVLSLFGNIPIAPAGALDASPFASWLPPSDEAALLVGVTFGTLHPQWDPVATATWLRTTAQRHGRTALLLILGHAGPGAARVMGVFHQQGALAVEVGELDAWHLSRLLRAADFGIAPHPWALIGKSGAAAAMLEHGLPVVVPRDEWRLRRPASSTAEASDTLLVRLAELDAHTTDRWLDARRAPAPALPAIADAFLGSLAHTPLRS